MMFEENKVNKINRVIKNLTIKSFPPCPSLGSIFWSILLTQTPRSFFETFVNAHISIFLFLF